MRNLFYTLILIVGFSTVSVAQEINWVTLEEAVELQKKKPKKNHDGYVHQLVWSL